LISQYAKHNHVRLVHRGNAAILCALYIAKKHNPKPFILVPDMGGWISFKKYPPLFHFEVRIVKTNRGIIDLIDLEKKADGGAALILTSHAGYFAQQPLSYISNICKKHNCLLIEDASPAVGDKELCNGDYSDIIVASFGEHKPVNNCYGGFISVKNQEFFADSSTIFSTTNFNPRNPEALLKKLADVPNRLDRFYALQEKVKTELEGLGFKILHRDKKGLNVMVKPMTDEEKTRLLDYCKKKKFEFVQCPKYIRLEEDAISIELKRLNI